MTRLPLTVAMSEYDQVADLMNGRVKAEGLDLTCLSLPIEEIFFRFITYREFDISRKFYFREICIPHFAERQDETLTAIPVCFPCASRGTRRSMFVKTDLFINRLTWRDAAWAYPNGRKPQRSTRADS